MEYAPAPTLADTLEAITDWSAQKYTASYRAEFKKSVQDQFQSALGADFADVPLTLAESALNELCFILAHSNPASLPTSAANFSTICTQLVTTIGFGAKRASKADVVTAMNALELMRLKEGN